ncbi:MAG: hypothetical protein ACRDRS_05660 [Pseudonocardiaceae bacterium]
MGRNTALRGLLDEAELSNAALGRAVVAAGAREGTHVGTNTTSVRPDAGWLSAALAGAETDRQRALPAAAA